MTVGILLSLARRVNSLAAICHFSDSHLGAGDGKKDAGMDTQTRSDFNNLINSAYEGIDDILLANCQTA